MITLIPCDPNNSAKALCLAEADEAKAARTLCEVSITVKLANKPESYVIPSIIRTSRSAAPFNAFNAAR
jgi:hypothetical protein